MQKIDRRSKGILETLQDLETAGFSEITRVVDGNKADLIEGC